MKKIRLGKTGLMVTKPAMGCLPLQRCERDYGVRLVRAAYEAGINFFDTANAYTDSESKMGEALHGVRGNVVLATKSAAKNRAGVLAHVENSLRMFRTDYIDILQLHNVAELPDADDPEGPYAGALEAKKRGMIGHIGVSTHKITVAEECIDSGLFDTMQFPFCYISSERDLALAGRCKAADMGYIAMKGLAGGLLTNARACHAFMERYDNVVPIWGIQRLEELEEWLAVAKEFERDPGAVDDAAIWDFIAKERQELSGSFCRSCGYCMPCPAGIEIRNCARMNMLLRRSPWQQYFSPEWRAKMEKINECLGCGKCRSKCPYELDTPHLLKCMLRDYNEFYEAHKHLLPA
ncbi:MAG: aldo/keto reductase [Mailhella sp.]|nr:aldo/keto reductase [Mailhella sp.]